MTVLPTKPLAFRRPAPSKTAQAVRKVLDIPTPADHATVVSPARAPISPITVQVDPITLHQRRVDGAIDDLRSVAQYQWVKEGPWDVAHRRAFIKGSRQFLWAARLLGEDVAEDVLTAAVAEVVPGITMDDPRFGLGRLLVKTYAVARMDFDGRRSVMAQYIRGTFEWRDAVRDYGEALAEQAVCRVIPWFAEVVIGVANGGAR